MKVISLLVFLLYLNECLGPPIENNYNDLSPQERIRHRKKNRPCRNGNGRTFFDLHYSYVNVFNTYLSDCGGYGGYGPIIPPPGLGGHHQHGGGLLGSHGGGLLGSHGGGLLGSHGGGGGGFGSQHSAVGNNDNGGLFGLGLFNWPNWGLLNFNSRPNNKPKPSETEPSDVTEASTEPSDYEDEKPVSEDHDEVALDRYQNVRPNGNRDVINFNPSKVVRRVNKGFDDFFKPLFDLFR